MAEEVRKEGLDFSCKVDSFVLMKFSDDLSGAMSRRKFWLS